MEIATVPDFEAFKAAARDQWDKAAPGWNNHTASVRTWLRSATDAMLEMAEIRPGARVLDVAAGAGDQTLDISVVMQGLVSACENTIVQIPPPGLSARYISRSP